MLQKEFFGVDSFNPRPYWDNTILNLSGALKFEEDTVFMAGIYSVDVQAGSSGSADFLSVPSRKVIRTFVVPHPFFIRAYCGSKAGEYIAGTNPYVGPFKVNGVANVVDVPSVNHIFGNAGSAGAAATGHHDPSSGNCLGNGVLDVHFQATGSGAGSCLHFIPVGGTFGSDYLVAVHVAAGAPGGLLFCGGGAGSAYGGAGSGGANSNTGHGATSRAGGSTPYGSGGAGVHASAGPSTTQGQNGSGIGAGRGGRKTMDCYGGAAYFDGINWVDANSDGVFATSHQDGHIIVKYLGAIN